MTVIQFPIVAWEINGRKATKAMFMQLVEEDIFDWETEDLRGEALGRVNYLIDDPPEVAIQIVWKRGQALRRCRVSKQLDRENLHNYPLDENGVPKGGDTPWGNFTPFIRATEDTRQSYSNLIDVLEDIYDSYEDVVAPLWGLPRLFVSGE